MKIGGLTVNKKPQNYYNAMILATDLASTQRVCLSYEKSLAESFGINTSGGKWRQELKNKLNEGYGSNNRNTNYSQIMTTDELYDLLMTGMSSDKISDYLFSNYSSFEGSRALADTVQKGIKKLQNKDTEVTVDIVKGNIDEYITSFFRGVQFNSGSVSNTERRSAAFPLKVKFDIKQRVPEIKADIHWENKSGINANYLKSQFHFGTYSTIETFLGGDIFQSLRDDVVSIIYEGRLLSGTSTGKKSWRYKCEAYVKLATAYIKWRLSEGDILFTNSRGDINLASEILDGFLNQGKLEVDVETEYQGKLTQNRLDDIDEKYIASWQEEAKKHVNEISEKVAEHMQKATGKRLQVKVNYGYRK